MNITLDAFNRAILKSVRSSIRERSRANGLAIGLLLNPSRASSGETLYISVPRLDEKVVLVPGTMGLVFDLTVSSHANNSAVNVSRAPVQR